MNTIPDDQTEQIARSVRVVFPVQVSFAGASFSIKEFTANLSVGGIFLPTTSEVAPQSVGTLTFRLSQWDKPFTVKAEVVRLMRADEASPGNPAGLGIRFVDLKPADLRRLERLVEGIQDGSVAQAIRRSIREEGANILQELRRRPTDQKVTLAFFAQGEEIDALIRDGNPSVLIRLLDNPRLTVANVRLLLRNRLPVKILIALARTSRWLDDDEARYLYCVHPMAPLPNVLQFLPRLQRSQLQLMERNGNLRLRIRDRARQLIPSRP